MQVAAFIVSKAAFFAGCRPEPMLGGLVSCRFLLSCKVHVCMCM